MKDDLKFIFKSLNVKSSGGLGTIKCVQIALRGVSSIFKSKIQFYVPFENAVSCLG